MMLPENEYYRAAETLLASTSGYSSYGATHNPELSNSQSINTVSSIRPEIVISEDLIAGQRLNGTMSNIRRFFCLFVTFDLLLTCLMWIICIMLNGDNLVAALKEEILQYDIRYSLFDIVMAAICRFTILLLFYALLYINHWVIIAICTSGTCIFLISKVFVFNWTVHNQPVFEVLLILASFILSWSEAWFLDFRVIPQEINARRYLVTAGSERTPLVRNYIQSLPSQYTESVGNFYSPLQSPEGSIFEFDGRARNLLPTLRLTRQEEDLYKSKGAKIKEDAWRTLNNAEWKIEKQSTLGDTVETLSCPKTKKAKLFRLTGVVNMPPRFLLDELFYRVDEMCKWNRAVVECSKVCTIDEYTDVSYQVSSDSGGGIISSRDFVNLRHWGVIDGCYVIAFSSVEHPDLPNRDGFVRGENNIGCFVMRPINDEPKKCVFQWLLNTNLKGWIPQYVIDTALTSVMLDYLNDLRLHAEKLKQSGKIA